MRNDNIDLKEFGDLALALSHYYSMASHFKQMSVSQREKLTEFYDRKIKSLDAYNQWDNICIHIIPQTWASTAGGRGGIGGSAITTSRTTIIENKFYGFACIYYGAKLVYICEIDDKYRSITDNYLPAYYECDGKLTIIFKNSSK